MSDHNRKGRSKKKYHNFIVIERHIMRSAAWQSLSLGARCAYLEFLYCYDGSNNGRLAMSARTLAQRLPLGHVQCSRCILELTAKGFIEVVQAGGFNRKHEARRAAEYRLTSEKCDVTGELATNAFMRQGAGGQEPPRDTGDAARKNGAGQ